MRTFFRLLWRGGQLVEFLFQSKSRYRVHSPFVYQFLERVILNPAFPSELKEIEAFRSLLAKEKKRTLRITDFGSGYSGDGKSFRVVSMSEVIRSSARRQASGRFLYHTIRFLKPRSVLELGTNLGFSTLYIAMAMASHSLLITVEGDPTLAALAENHFQRFSLPVNPTVVNSPFDPFLFNLNHYPPFDFIFIDGHHHGPSLLSYLSRLKPHLNPSGGILLDDIRWSRDMFHAFLTLCNDPDFTLTLDLFSMGFLFYQKPMEKQHFQLFPPLLS